MKREVTHAANEQRCIVGQLQQPRLRSAELSVGATVIV